jgi:PAS domain S-box-containing protein
MAKHKSLSRIYRIAATVAFIAASVLSVGNLAAYLGHVSPASFLGPNFTLMSTNVSIFIFLFAIAGLLFQRGLTIFAFTFGLLSILCGGALFSEYALQDNYGASELFLAGASSTESHVPPNASLVILLMGMAALFLSKYRAARALILSAFLASFGVFAISLLTIAGGVFHLTLFSQVDPDAVASFLEPAIFTLLALAYMLQVASIIDAAAHSNPRAFLPTKVGSFLVLATCLLWVAAIQESADIIRSKVADVANQQSIAILNQIAVHIKQVRRLADQFPLSEGAYRELWATSATLAAKDLGDVDQLEVVDTASNIIWKLPTPAAEEKAAEIRKSNPKFLEARAALVAEALSSKKMQYSTILPAGRNKNIMLVAAPVLDKKEVKGVALFSFVAEIFFNAIPPIEDFEWSVHQKGLLIFPVERAEEVSPQEKWSASIHVPSIRVNWSVRMVPTLDKIRALGGPLPTLLLIAGFIISMISASLLHLSILATERSREARLARKKFYAASNLNSRCLFEAELDGEFLWVNQAWIGITGLSETDSLGVGWRKGIYPDDQEQVQAAWTDGVATGEPFALSFRLVARDGALYPVTCDFMIIQGDAGEPDALVGALGFAPAHAQA